MTDDIERIKAKHFANEAAKSAAEAEKAKQEAAANAQAEEAGKGWVAMQATAQVITNALDQELRSAGLKLTCEVQPSRNAEKTDVAGLGRIVVVLHGTSKEKQLILNVSRTGHVRPVALIPHSGRSGSDFLVSEVDGPRIRAEIMAFLEQATEPD